MDTSLYRSYNNDTRRKSKLNRTALRTRLEPDEIQANRSWRRTVSILKLGDAKQELRDLETSGPSWSQTVDALVRQQIRDDRDLVARLNHKVLLSK